MIPLYSKIVAAITSTSCQYQNSIGCVDVFESKLNLVELWFAKPGIKVV